jgi:hypothetical protein
MLRRAVTASFVLLTFTALSFAQGKPNLSGTWKLNTSKSDFGVLPGPDSRTDVIEHADPVLTDHVDASTAQGPQKYTMNLTTDGKEAVNQLGPNQAKSTATWDGSNLVVNTNLKYNDQDVVIKSVWTVSPDGKTLTQEVHLASPMGETDQKLVYEKQDAGAPAIAKAQAPMPPSTPAAGGKPNFSGTWKLNTAKSDFGPLPGPDSQTSIIEQNDPALKVNSKSTGGPQGDQNITLNFTTDGKETVNSVGGNDVKSTAAWEGNNLIINAKLKFQDQDVAIKYVWTLAPDGKTMTQDVHYTSPMGEADQKVIFDKQDGGIATTAPTPAPTAPMPSGAHPNFSGVWKLNTGKSDFGVMPGPDVRTDTIDHTDPTLKLSRKENGPDGAREYVLSMTTDGKETVNSLGGADAKITASWEGSGLVISFKLKIQDQDIAIRQVATLSPDGKTLTNKAHVSMSLGEMDQTEVYDRQ